MNIIKRFVIAVNNTAAVPPCTGSRQNTITGTRATIIAQKSTKPAQHWLTFRYGPPLQVEEPPPLQIEASNVFDAEWVYIGKESEVTTV